MNELLQEDLLSPSLPPLVLCTSSSAIRSYVYQVATVLVTVLRIHECGEGVKPQTPLLLEMTQHSVNEKLNSMLEIQSS